MLQHCCYCPPNLYGKNVISFDSIAYCKECNGIYEKEKSMESSQVKVTTTLDQTNPKDLLGVKKPRLSLVPPVGLIYAALAMANGADRYGPYNWREKKVQTMIYLEAAMRHILSYQDGEECAKDSGVPHLGHALACLLIIIDAKETGNLVDNRPKPGAMADVIERYTKK